jgi:DNA primase
VYYPEEIVEEVRQRNDIVDVISGYVRLTKKGNNHFGLCPFHNEKTPSFSVSGPKQMYHCFGCGASGNVFTFLMNYENYSFVEAVKSLAQRAGVTLPEVEYTEQMRQKENRRARLLEINKEAAKYYYYQLRAPQGKSGYDYFAKRQLSDETMKNFGLGFSNKTSNDLCLYLKQKGYSEELIRDAGLAIFNERYGFSDKFWNRVMFPIQDINHRVIGFGGRVMGDGEPKYLNSPETEIFDKSRNLYGLNFARTSRESSFILCEGYMDVIALHQAGFKQAVASLGTAFTSGQANLLRRYVDQVFLCYDSDGAGTKAALRAIGILKEAGIIGRVIDLKPYKDPDEFIKNLGADEFQQRLIKAQNSFLYEIGQLEKAYDLTDPAGKTRFHNEIAKKLCGFEEEVERENYIEAIAEKYHIGYEALRKLVFSYASKTGMVAPAVRPKSGQQEKKRTAEDKEKLSQRLLLTWLIEEPGLFEKVKKYLSPEDFTDELYQEVAGLLFDDLSQGKVNPAAIISHFTEEEKQQEVGLVFQTSLEEMQTRQEKERAFHDIIVGVKRNSYNHFTKKLGSDVTALARVIEGKKALEELERTHISLEQG